MIVRVCGYLISDGPFTLSQRFVVEINVTNIQAFMGRYFSDLSHHGFKPHKCIIITFHYVLGRDSMNLVAYKIQALLNNEIIRYTLFNMVFKNSQTTLVQKEKGQCLNLHHTRKLQQSLVQQDRSCPKKALLLCHQNNQPLFSAPHSLLSSHATPMDHKKHYRK